jgi:D-alanyl-D-alanine carboxypeptidase/D-alanyl-D-alanine-endopeptidase (penicillin-binding protein 4)
VLASAAKSFPSTEQLAGMVVDAASGMTLWSHDPNQPMAPASTTKLLTAAAALKTLGPDYRLTTSTKEVGNTLYLVGGGDPTLIESASSPVIPAYPLPASLADLAGQTAAALTPGAPVRLRVDTSAWTGPTSAKGWQPSYVTEGDVAPPSALELDGGRLHPDDFDSERTPTPTAQAVTAFVALLKSDGVVLKGQVKKGVAPATATAVASVSSPPVSALVERMLTQSDNDLAEALGRAVAIHAGSPGDFTDAAQAVSTAVGDLGVPMANAALFDTSGLSHDDRLDPATLVGLLRLAASSTDTALRPILEGLPVAGFTGTLANRYRDHLVRAGAGVVRAKTGTLTGVNALAGVVVDGEGRLVAFALMASGSDAESTVETALDRFAGTIAELGCGSATSGVSNSSCDGTLER